MTDSRFDAIVLREKYQPHWIWGLAFVAIPASLIVIGFAGVTLGSPIPLSLASAAPKAALTIVGAGMVLALYMQRRVPMQIAATGLVITAAGFFLLQWLSA